MNRTRIAFIGGGNMAQSLIAGLIADGHEAAALTVSDPLDDKRQQLAATYGIKAAADNAAAIAEAQVVMLCVKPQSAPAVCRELAASLPHTPPLIISIMAGVTEASLCHWLGRPLALVRAMPNTPVMVQSGAIGLHANAETTPTQQNLAEEILRAGGLTRWVEREADLDAITALSGSGPAYFLLFMEALEKAGIEQGLSADTARLLSIQTALGAARMAMESDESPAQLRQRVTSPGGTTERALNAFADGGLETLVSRAVNAARQRAGELSALLGAEK
ncbi:pyrroline-5-carboxylate reductase [Thiohalocapsa marina]|uniref:Pyrroline-5-carboxylate reductase n=1 Tax=Thiohalocapsa marina TaxID=424902 RepID=A0A5M8FKS5_9GAMM|nr:pyrroline-5-carboxylate reductase [Thiohalocapsa marina]KAA6185307.1 pyrroline-5-carboxylate reductase [Thiohalocapsa marina]